MWFISKFEVKRKEYGVANVGVCHVGAKTQDHIWLK